MLLLRRDATAVVLTKRSALGLLVLILLAGMLVGRSLATDGAAGAAARQDEATPASETGTVESETDELNRLRTQVAQTPVCGLPSPTPELSPTATPTPVPAVAAGTPISPPIEGVKPSGKFLRVNATVTNNAGESRTYPFRSWVLIDDQVRTFEIADDATSQATGSGWYRGVDPSLPQDFAIIFDVALDSGKSFVLESRDDPILRVSLQIQVLG